MTPDTIEHAIRMAFTAMYPRHVSIGIDGQGSEELSVCILIQGCPAIVYKCELDSDDDGFFHFMLEDCLIEVLVPYPES